MTEFVALKAKIYVYKKIDKKMGDKRCKGTNKCVATENLTFDDYKACLFDVNIIYREQMLVENKNNKVYTVNNHNIALNRDDSQIDYNNVSQRICSALGLMQPPIKDVFLASKRP